MADPFSPEEEETFENLWARFTMQPMTCEARFCKKPLGTEFHIVLHGKEQANCCSWLCALKLSKEMGEKISTHIKVGKLNVRKK